MSSYKYQCLHCFKEVIVPNACSDIDIKSYKKNICPICYKDAVKTKFKKDHSMKISLRTIIWIVLAFISISFGTYLTCTARHTINEDFIEKFPDNDEWRPDGTH